MDEEKIIEKIRNFLEQKEGLEVESCYFLSKKLNELYWDEVQTVDSEEEGEIEDDEFGDDEPEEKPKETPPVKKSSTIKKTKIRLKEPEPKVEEPEDEF